MDVLLLHGKRTKGQGWVRLSLGSPVFLLLFLFLINLCCENSCRTTAYKSKVRYAIILKLRKFQTIFSQIRLESPSM